MDLETTETETETVETVDFKTELAKAFAISAATTAGMFVGTFAVGFVKTKLDARQLAKEVKIQENSTETE